MNTLKARLQSEAMNLKTNHRTTDLAIIQAAVETGAMVVLELMRERVMKERELCEQTRKRRNAHQ
jgi:hypothetical protein